ncbi:hypothetical protein QR680_015719 [Steinernema hermaphroditum]|uniref:Uncharacterized protein n=1 Tax=Steinernema hermaphroditum TaxID=289476 RepID=A0AA39LLD7_9BILA|nr:hypothetical protein QR680_015719 [Steinernema hermaphroditum]
MKTDRRYCVLLLALLLGVDALKPKPSFESVILQAIEDLPDGGRLDDVPTVEGHVSVLNALDNVLSFFRTTMAPPTSSKLFDNPSLSEKARGDSDFSSHKPKALYADVKSKKKRRPMKKQMGISRRKLNLVPVDHPPNTTSKKKTVYKVSSYTERNRKFRNEGNFRLRKMRPSVHVGTSDRSSSVSSRFLLSPKLPLEAVIVPKKHRDEMKKIPRPPLDPPPLPKKYVDEFKRPKQIEVEPSPILHEEEDQIDRRNHIMSAEPIMEVDSPIDLRPLPASLYNAPEFCKKCFKHWMEKAPTATDTELLEYCCVAGVNKKRLG